MSLFFTELLYEKELFTYNFYTWYNTKYKIHHLVPTILRYAWRITEQVIYDINPLNLYCYFTKFKLKMFTPLIWKKGLGVVFTGERGPNYALSSIKVVNQYWKHCPLIEKKYSRNTKGCKIKQMLTKSEAWLIFLWSLSVSIDNNLNFIIWVFYLGSSKWSKKYQNIKFHSATKMKNYYNKLNNM